jgi:nitroreductase/NAD-dependent dihydropyrimidine dehydrogenase PreA subunit
MGIIEIDETRCKRDGFCANECPSGLIRLAEGSFPKAVPGAEKLCMRCGHCVAVCPHGALSHNDIPVQGCPSIRDNLVLDREQVVQLLRSRRSIRQYRRQPVEEEKIQELIEVARYAPTGGNTQTVEWWVYTDRKDIRRFAELTAEWIRQVLQTVPARNLPPYFPPILTGWDAGRDTILRDAPVLILAMAPAESPNGLVEVSIALTYLQLAALPMGLGTCWAGLIQRALLQYPPLKEAFGLPQKTVNHYPTMLGYPKTGYSRVPERKPPRIHWR